MDPRQAPLDAAVADGAVPFIVAALAGTETVAFSGAAGDTAPGSPAATDMVFRIYSMTKAVAAVAAMILVERRRLDLDAPVASILPEFAELQVLEGFDGDTPRLRPASSRATVRQLLTHTSGLEYEFWNADVTRWLAASGQPSAMSGRLAGLNYPLTFDPGTRWAYGIGPDWLGRVIARVDGRAVDQLCTEEIFVPLGMADTAFTPTASMLARLGPVYQRKGDAFAPSRIALPDAPEHFGMGYALHATTPDYLRFLRMLLRGGELDGTRLLKVDTVATMLENQIGGLRVAPMASVSPKSSADVDLFPGMAQTHSLLGVRLEQDVPGRRAAGSAFWAGILNTHWWLDPARGIAGVWMTQMLPFADPRAMAALEAFERAAYAAR